MAVACAAWWTAPRHVAPPPVSIAKRLIPAALVAVITVTVGVVAYLGHAPGVSTGRAIGGAVVAVLASVLPLSLYWAAGRFVRDLVDLVLAWLASLAPLYIYAVIESLIVVAYTQCGPGSSECPLG